MYLLRVPASVFIRHMGYGYSAANVTPVASVPGITGWRLLPQVTLYQLLMEERYGQPIEQGLLWYLDQATPEIVHRSPYEVRLPPFLISMYCQAASQYSDLQQYCITGGETLKPVLSPEQGYLA
jgi:hypothetical protein